MNESPEAGVLQIVDRPTQGHMFLSREYVQPQWIYDCVNARTILPTEAYLVGRYVLHAFFMFSLYVPTCILVAKALV